MKKYLYSILGLVLAGSLGFAIVAKANPSYFSPTIVSAIATSTVSFLTPGTGTTTLQYDTYNTGNTYKTNTAALLTQFTGSSTSAILGISFEYSQDGIDWYKNYVIDPNGQSTTTPSITFGPPSSISWKYATVVIGSSTVATATSTAVITVPTPTRFVRAVYSMTGANGAIWDEWVPNKETP